MRLKSANEPLGEMHFSIPNKISAFSWNYTREMALFGTYKCLSVLFIQPKCRSISSKMNKTYIFFLTRHKIH